MSRRRHYQSVDAVRNEAGVGDQSNECVNGTEGCPGPDTNVPELPCFECLLEADGDREVATDGGTDRTKEGVNPHAPHWFDFNRLNETPSDWTFEVLEWDDDPDADGVVDRGEAEVVRGDHRFTVTTWLQPRARTHDRYWSVAYETINQDGEPELLSFHISRDQAIARNNLGHARDSIDEDATPHVLVRDHNDGPRETFEFPTASMAEKAADLQTRLKLENDDRDYLVTVHSKEEWEDRLELEREVVTDGGVVSVPRVTWPRRVENGQPIVGYYCDNCGHEIERPYQPALLCECPNCGGNPQGVRRFDVEPFVDERRERLREQLAERYGHPMGSDRECAVCGATEDVHLDPGENLEDFEYRCGEHHLFGYSYWWQPGDHPSLLTREWIETCDNCHAEFTSVFGVSYLDHRAGYQRDLCLQCTDVDWLRRAIDDTFALEGGDD
ncbi:hypothetical protein [Natrarchaeobius oligotrophus]|uniref:hypothetical protein n=1 Tax=Natrarchaeobius oligotrophus TaxID=3455743 RepID=UPI001A9F2B3B|nr:hypothetical protein [Natrarchaeobius chitinivorans]